MKYISLLMLILVTACAGVNFRAPVDAGKRNNEVAVDKPDHGGDTPAGKAPKDDSGHR